jgi:Protein of unknown function (DUF3723)
VVWGSILDNAELFPLVDPTTVSLLQTRFPKYSSQDSALIKQLMDNRELFPAITEESIRTRILNRLLSLNCMIPSLYTFFEDTIYIEACAQVLRGLLPKKYKGSMRVAIMRRYKGIGQEEGKAKVQTSENIRDEFVESSASELQCIKSGYYQLWLFAMRHWPELTGILPRKDPGAPKPKIGGSGEKWWPRLGLLAYQLGFDSPEITRLRVQSPDWIIVDSFLHQARPRDIYRLDGEAHTRIVQGICNLIEPIELKELHHSLPKLTSDANEAPPEQRCGKPFNSSHQRDAKHLFLDNICQDQPSSSGDYVSSFAVRKQLFLAFFGHRTPVFSVPAQSKNRQEAEEGQSLEVPETENSNNITSTKATRGDSGVASGDPQQSSASEQDSQIGIDNNDTSTGSSNPQQSEATQNIDPKPLGTQEREGDFAVPENSQLGSPPTQPSEQAVIESGSIQNEDDSGIIKILQQKIAGGNKLIFFRDERQYTLITKGQGQQERFSREIEDLAKRRYWFAVIGKGRLVYINPKTAWKEVMQNDIICAGKKKKLGDGREQPTILGKKRGARHLQPIYAKWKRTE